MKKKEKAAIISDVIVTINGEEYIRKDTINKYVGNIFELIEVRPILKKGDFYAGDLLIDLRIKQKKVDMWTWMPGTKIRISKA